MDVVEHEGEQAQPSTAWGDAVMPGAAAERQASMSRLHARDQASDATSDKPAAHQPHEDEADIVRDEPLLYVGGRPVTPDEGPLPPYTAPLPQTDAVAGNWTPLLGPGNEAMEDGSSPAPRGFTGGAMGRVVSGLIPSFPEAACGTPPVPAALSAVNTAAEHTAAHRQAGDINHPR